MAAAHPSAGIDVLMYHSISTEPGPTSIAPDVFKMQMHALAEHGYKTISLDDFVTWWRGERVLSEKTVVVTFDDGFADFAQNAHPVMKALGFRATVFLPADCMGGAESWEGANLHPRALMSWDEVRALANDGVDFGGHGLTHPDLTRLAPDEMRRQIRVAKEAIEQHIDRPVSSFAPPYGRSSPAVKEEIAKHYQVSVGTRLARAMRTCDLFDVPRIEMFYYRDDTRWRNHLDQRGASYLRLRQFLRGARAALRSA